MNPYAGYFDRNSKYMNLLVGNEKLLEKYNEKLDKIKIYLKKSLIVKQYIMINTIKLK